MRFNDSLQTVLAADMTPGVGAQAAWRQLVDLIGRGRVAADAATLARLRALRGVVPATVRAASARALAAATPGPELVALFAEDEHAVAAPVLRAAALPEDAWCDLLGRLSPAGRAVLRRRRDLPAKVVRGLDSFGPVDFALSYDGAATDAPEPAGDATPPADALREPPVDVSVAPPADAPPSSEPFVAPDPARSEIAELVARIAAFQRDRDRASIRGTGAGTGAGGGAMRSFVFETDANGIVRAADGVSRGALVGVSLVHAGPQGSAQVDAAVAAAVRRRTPFAGLRLEMGGAPKVAGSWAGSWRIAGVPAFDRRTGRFTGFTGAARRPRRHETAASMRDAATDSLRQLVHELRTPANAVAGFAELIESELLGPVSDTYRARAGAIRAQVADLLAAIEDLDTAARLVGGALDLRPGEVPLQPLLARLAHELRPLAEQRGATLAIGGGPATAAADDRATERLLARLLTALLSAASEGERLEAVVGQKGAMIAVVLDRPRALADLPGDALFRLDDTDEAGEGGPLLGAAFTLRLVRNLATELGGALSIGSDRLTLWLPAAATARAEHASTR